MKKIKKGLVFRQDRHREFKDIRQDTYKSKKKLKEPTRCPDCGSLFIDGRWTWNDTDEETEAAICPACQRIKDHYPAGLIELSGPFFKDHKQEIMHMVRNIERIECEEHPLERIMKILDKNEHLLVTTTGMHLGRRIGDSLKQAYQGDLNISYEAEHFVRVSWQR